LSNRPEFEPCRYNVTPMSFSFIYHSPCLKIHNLAKTFLKDVKGFITNNNIFILLNLVESKKTYRIVITGLVDSMFVFLCIPKNIIDEDDGTIQDKKIICQRLKLTSQCTLNGCVKVTVVSLLLPHQRKRKNILHFFKASLSVDFRKENSYSVLIESSVQQTNLK
ncbi:hypothetical protein L9F63_007709, partial [Diploptera punctata]